MPRVHWAARCRAHSSRTGLPCGAWAVRGARVCVAHGGALRKTRREAAVRLAGIVLDRAFGVAWVKWQRRLVDFQVDRVLTAAQLLDIPVTDVTPVDIVWCHVRHGVPPLDDQAPRITDVPLDGRFRRYFYRAPASAPLTGAADRGSVIGRAA